MSIPEVEFNDNEDIDKLEVCKDKRLSAVPLSAFRQKYGVT